MNKLMTLLDDRITLNSLNGKSEAVTALLEYREASLREMLEMEAQVSGALTRIQSSSSAQIFFHQQAEETLLKLLQGFRS
jgi:hypothetical protein